MADQLWVVTSGLYVVPTSIKGAIELATGAAISNTWVQLDVTFDGDNLVLIGASASQRSHLTFVDAGAATLFALEIAAGEAWAWISNTGITNPLTGNAVASIKASNGDSTNASNLKLTGLQYAA